MLAEKSQVKVSKPDLGHQKVGIRVYRAIQALTRTSTVLNTSIVGAVTTIVGASERV